MAAEEIFLINMGNEKEATEMYICTTVEEVNSILEDESFGNATSGIIKIYQGVIVPANFIPNNLRACTPYVLLFKEGELVNATDIYEVDEPKNVYFEKLSRDSSDKVADKVQELINLNPLEKKVGFRKVKARIEDVRLFFGHQLQPILNISEANLDEELVERVSSLADDMEKYNKKLEEGKIWQMQT